MASQRFKIGSFIKELMSQLSLVTEINQGDIYISNGVPHIVATVDFRTDVVLVTTLSGVREAFYKDELVILLRPVNNIVHGL